MSRIAVVYWSGTGNTQRMAEAAAEGASSAGAQAELVEAVDFSADKLAEYDAVAFGCPAMGAEQLEDSEFEPMFLSCEPLLKDRKIALFGSYGWGGGEWMKEWEQSCKEAGAVLVCDSVTCSERPDDEALTSCQALGAALAG